MTSEVIAEGGVNEVHWHGAGSQEQVYTSVGAFFFGRPYTVYQL